MQVDRRPAWLLVGLLLVAGCGGDGGADSDESAATTTSAPARRPTSTSTSIPPVDPSVIPEDPAAIDEAYVEAVLEEHNRVIGDALRLQLQGAELEEIVDRYNAIYVPEVADLLLTDALGEDEAALREYKRPPADAITRVVSVDEVSASCIVALVQQDTSGYLVDPGEPFEAQVVLRRGPASSNPSGLNGTAWLSEGLEPASTDEERRCVG